MKKTLFLLAALIIFSIPAFGLMLRPGIYTMQDFHPFRQYEFNLCIQDKIFPCRWAPDSGKGYGEPIFNFYGQFPYWIGELFIKSGFQIIDSVKALFIISLIGSGISMYFFARRYWGNMGGLISAVFYIYAPYRAVDVWVRGALPEAFSFIFFPLILLLIDKCVSTRRLISFLNLSLIVALLVINHNLSAFMFLPFMIFWWTFNCIKQRSFGSLKGLIVAALLAIGLSAFYLVPVIKENLFITINKTTQGYYNYQLHFATLKQLFISRFWGYGGSDWGPNDTMSFSVGQVIWIIPLLIGFFVLLIRRFKDPRLTVFYICLALGLFSAFLTHGKSEFIWKLIPPLAYVQFPWRFLSMSVLFLSLSSGAAVYLVPPGLVKITVTALISLAIATNVSYFRYDIWRTVTDKEQFSGALWDEQRSSALQDFWPVTSLKQPVKFAPVNPIFLTGKGSVLSVEKRSSSARFQVLTNSESMLAYPVVYFPGWKMSIDGVSVPFFASGDLGLMTSFVPVGKHTVSLDFIDTIPRIWGNSISLACLGIYLFAVVLLPLKYEKL